MMKEIKAYVATCDVCQHFKTTINLSTGKLPLRDSHSVEPFQVLMVDLCGLWKMWAKVQTEDNVKDKTVILEKIVIILLFFV